MHGFCSYRRGLIFLKNNFSGFHQFLCQVESLGMCRESSSSRSEPSDAIRAVNALLTQIDRIRRRDNVLILCTSNLESTLDKALVDRADIVKNVGQPSDFARYSMLKSSIMELARIGVVIDNEVHTDYWPQDICDVSLTQMFRNNCQLFTDESTKK